MKNKYLKLRYNLKKFASRITCFYGDAITFAFGHLQFASHGGVADL